MTAARHLQLVPVLVLEILQERLMFYLEVMSMDMEKKSEVFRAKKAGFKREFADFLIDRQEDNWLISRCTFFQSAGKKWASCEFER
jgi:hypothetical protein